MLTNNITKSTRHFSTLVKKQTELTSVPEIDFEPFIKGNKADKLRVADQIDFACTNSGFFMVRNHGIDQSIIDNAFNSCKLFQELPLEDKEEVKVSGNYAQGQQAVENLSLTKENEDMANIETERQKQLKNLADLKETWAVCLGSKLLEDSNQTNVDLKGFSKPKWHSKPACMKQNISIYQRSMENLSNHILEAFTHCLDLPNDQFSQRNTHHLSALRTLNQAQIADLNNIDPDQLRCSAHSDWGTVTILKEKLLADQQYGQTGLQLEGKDKWQDVRVPEDCFTINLGDLMALMTNDRWRSTNHRVSLPNSDNNQRRMSIAQFQNLNSDVMIDSLDGDYSKNELLGKITAGEYLMKKFQNANQY